MTLICSPSRRKRCLLFKVSFSKPFLSFVILPSAHLSSCVLIILNFQVVLVEFFFPFLTFLRLKIHIILMCSFWRFACPAPGQRGPSDGPLSDGPFWGETTENILILTLFTQPLVASLCENISVTFFTRSAYIWLCFTHLKRYWTCDFSIWTESRIRLPNCAERAALVQN